MRNIPNIITSIRLIAAILLLVDCALGTAPRHFMYLFIAAAISDILDGFIARRFNWCTEFGARLDSISDLSLYIAASLFLCCFYGAIVKSYTPLIVLGASAQISHLIYSYRRHSQFPAYHTDFSRVSAYVIGFGVIAFVGFGLQIALPVIAVLWTLCSVEGAVITAVLPRGTNDVAGITAALKLARERSGQNG